MLRKQLLNFLTVIIFKMEKSTLVLGASLKSERYSNKAVHKLVEKGCLVYAYGLKKGIVSGVIIDTDLRTGITVDTVTMYIGPARQKAYYDYIISLNPKRVLFNPGTENEAFYELLKANGIAFEVACTLVLLATNQY